MKFLHAFRKTQTDRSDGPEQLNSALEQCKEIGIEFPPYSKPCSQFSMLQSNDTATVAKFLSATTPEE